MYVYILYIKLCFFIAKSISEKIGGLRGPNNFDTPCLSLPCL